MNMQALLKQAQKMQKEISRVELDLKDKEYETTMGGGVIKIIANGNMEIKSIEIAKEIINEDGKEDLEELVKSAVNEIMTKINEDKNKIMNEVTGGVKMPGGF